MRLGKFQLLTRAAMLAVHCLVWLGASSLLPALAASNSRVDWMINCQGCHGATADGFGTQVPSMRETVSKFLTVRGGREYLVQVPGSANAAIDSKKLAALLNWMLRTFDPDHLPKDFKPYTEAEVSELRKTSLTSNALEIRQKLTSRIINKTSVP